MQSKRQSALEAVTNTAIGFVGSYLLTVLCMMYVHLNAAAQSLLIVVLCTVWSLVRGYYVRRFYNYRHMKQAQAEPEPDTYQDEVDQGIRLHGLDKPVVNWDNPYEGDFFPCPADPQDEGYHEWVTRPAGSRCQNCGRNAGIVVNTNKGVNH